MSPVDGWSVVPNLVQAFLCFYQVFFQRKPILEAHLKPFQDAAGRTFQGLYIILRNPLEKDIYLENLTLSLQRRRLAYRNPTLHTLSLTQPEAIACLAPESLAYTEILTGHKPLVPGRAMYLALTPLPLLPRPLLKEPALILTVTADLQGRPSLKARVNEVVDFSQWGDPNQRPQQVVITSGFW